MAIGLIIWRRGVGRNVTAYRLELDLCGEGDACLDIHGVGPM
jgi:hypothetical protein